MIKSFITVLCLVSWAASAFLILVIFGLNMSNTNLKNYAGALERNVALLNGNIKHYQQTAEAKTRFEDSAVDYLRWKFVLKEEVEEAGRKLEGKANNIKNMKKDKELANLIYYNLGLACTMATNFELAIKAFEEALQFDSRDAQSCYCLGLLYSTYRADADKAINYYNKYLELMPSGPKARIIKDRLDALKNKGKPGGEA